MRRCIPMTTSATSKSRARGQLEKLHHGPLTLGNLIASIRRGRDGRSRIWPRNSRSLAPTSLRLNTGSRSRPRARRGMPRAWGTARSSSFVSRFRTRSAALGSHTWWMCHLCTPVDGGPSAASASRSRIPTPRLAPQLRTTGTAGTVDRAWQLR